MATADLSSVANALAQLFQDQLYPQMNRATVLARLLPFQSGTGRNLAWDPEFGDPAPSGGSVLAEGTDVTVYNNDTVAPAKLDWGDYSEAFAVTGKAMAAASATGNPAELANLFAEKMERAVRRLCKSINKDLYTGNGAASTIMGLTDATAGGIMDAGTYAGLDRANATYAQWKGNVLANGGVNRPLSFVLMRDMRRKIYEACGASPDLIVCDAATHEAYGNLFQGARRYNVDITLRGEKINLEGGYAALDFDGIPVVADVDAPANKMLFLNSAQVKVRQLPDGPSGANRSPGEIQLHGTPEEQFGMGATRLMARINPLAVSGDSYKIQLICYPQLQVTQPNSCGVLADLTP